MLVHHQIVAFHLSWLVSFILRRTETHPHAWSHVVPTTAIWLSLCPKTSSIRILLDDLQSRTQLCHYVTGGQGSHLEHPVIGITVLETNYRNFINSQRISESKTRGAADCRQTRLTQEPEVDSSHVTYHPGGGKFSRSRVA